MQPDVIFRKILSANDTGETGGHQAGMLISKEGAAFFPKLDEDAENPSVEMGFTGADGAEWAFNYIYYNSKVRGEGTNNERRLTRMTSYFSKHGLSAGDTIVLTQDSRGLYHIDHETLPNDAARAEITEEIGAEEGGVFMMITKRYERNLKNRKLTVAIHGYKCKACGLLMSDKYGPVAKEFIEVHHLTPLSELKIGKLVDPKQEMVPLCPNCHRVVHRRNPAYTLEEIQEFIRKKENE